MIKNRQKKSSKLGLNWRRKPRNGEKNTVNVLEIDLMPFQRVNISDFTWIQTTESQRCTWQSESKLDNLGGFAPFFWS